MLGSGISHLLDKPEVGWYRIILANKDKRSTASLQAGQGAETNSQS